MSVAHSLMPPTGTPNQGFHPQALSPPFPSPQASLSPPMSPALRSKLYPPNQASFSPPFSPYRPPTPQTGTVPEIQQGWQPSRTPDTPQGQVSVCYNT